MAHVEVVVHLYTLTKCHDCMKSVKIAVGWTL